MKSITESVKSFLKREEIRFERIDDAGVFTFEFAGENGCFRGYIDPDTKRRAVQVRTLAPVRSPAN